VKDHLIPHIAKKKMVKEMFDALVMLYQSVNLSHKMLLKNKLTGTRMSKTNTVASYLMKITELRDQLAAIGEHIDESELVWITLNGFGPSWHHFV
jgi:2-phosphoglycerate kinase